MKKTLCWDCKKACGGESGCSWFNGFVPIPGWDAEENEFGYKINNCPQFVLEGLGGKRYVWIKASELAGLINVSLRTLQRHELEWVNNKLSKSGLECTIRKDNDGGFKNFYIRKKENDRERSKDKSI